MTNIESANASVPFRVIKSAIVILTVICFIIWQKYYAPTLEEETLQEAKPIVFHGKIDSIYRDEANHNVMKVILTDGYVYEIYRPWEQEIVLGDSLSKEKDSLYVNVFKKDEQKLTLDYRQLVKGFNKAWWEK